MPSETTKKLTVTTSQAEYLDKQLGRLRQWHEGFAAAGGKNPIDLDALRQIQLILKNGKYP